MTTGRLRPRDVRVHGGVHVCSAYVSAPRMYLLRVCVCSESAAAPRLRLLRVCGCSASASGRPFFFFLAEYVVN